MISIKACSMLYDVYSDTDTTVPSFLMFLVCLIHRVSVHGLRKVQILRHCNNFCKIWMFVCLKLSLFWCPNVRQCPNVLCDPKVILVHNVLNRFSTNHVL